MEKDSSVEEIRQRYKQAKLMRVCPQCGWAVEPYFMRKLDPAGAGRGVYADDHVALKCIAPGRDKTNGKWAPERPAEPCSYYIFTGERLADFPGETVK